ncbi:MAG: sphingomyelin phosphodiesterase [Sphingobacteriales bacterium JAD_PAG50586_3]|nr:MAG: sphingomyelin phosphodiesterase [Sphingobacteriales bacterium JAD_PAG50586_3]
MRGTLNGGTIKVLSWNIFMLPKVVGNTGQEMRAKGIVDALKNTDYDVIVFQEAWTKNTRAIIWEGLKSAYPYDAGKPFKGSATLTNSGIWIISKLPIKTRVDKLYRDCDGADCFARKGATLVEVEKDGKTFQIVGTHLQADEGKDKQKVRNEQYYDLNKLLGENQKDGVAQIIAGDFNTPVTDTTRYNYMLRAIKSEDGPLSGNMQYTWDNSTNDITHGQKDTSQVVLDYIFTRNNGVNFTSERRLIKRFQVRWACDKIDLSDHYAMEGVFEY